MTPHHVISGPDSETPPFPSKPGTVLSLWKGEIQLPCSNLPSMAAVAAEVAERLGLEVDDLVGPSRLKTIAHARQEAMWLIRQRTSFSYPRIGVFFHRHHTTVVHGCERHEKRRRKFTPDLVNSGDGTIRAQPQSFEWA